MLRSTKLSVMDEVANALSFYDSTFLRELPRLYGGLEDRLVRDVPGWVEQELPPFLHIGSWIDGDRDGNPYPKFDGWKITSLNFIELFLKNLPSGTTCS
jgi:phosphoenolpyruvate carboxylase